MYFTSFILRENNRKCRSVCGHGHVYMWHEEFISTVVKYNERSDQYLM
jgi:hypothetical protein